MTLGLPETFDANRSEKYILSIRLRSDGLSFSACNPQENGSFFYRETAFLRNRPYAESLKEFFFENELFSYPFRKVRLLCEASPYTLVPEAVYRDGCAERFLRFNLTAPAGYPLTDRLPEAGAVVVYGLDKDVFEFCSRSLLGPEFLHHITPLLAYWGKLSRTSLRKQLFADLHGNSVDVVCFERGKLLFANTFPFEQPNDILYYLLYVWKQQGMDQLNDSIRISGHPRLRMQLTETLHTYIRSVTVGEAPAETYLWGEEAVKAPLDLLTSALCEL